MTNLKPAAFAAGARSVWGPDDAPHTFPPVSMTTILAKHAELQAEAERTAYATARQDEFLRDFPVHAQLEALTEAAWGRPEKLNAMRELFDQIKARHPKPG